MDNITIKLSIGDVQDPRHAIIVKGFHKYISDAISAASPPPESRKRNNHDQKVTLIGFRRKKSMK